MHFKNCWVFFLGFITSRSPSALITVNQFLKGQNPPAAEGDEVHDVPELLGKVVAAPNGSLEKPHFLHKGPSSFLQGFSTFPEGYNGGSQSASQTFIGFSGALASGLEDDHPGFQLDLGSQHSHAPVWPAHPHLEDIHI